MCVVVPCGVDYKRVVANRRTSARTSSARLSPMRSRQPPSSRLGARVKNRRRERAGFVSVASNSIEAERGRGRTGTRDERLGSPRLSVRFNVSRSGSPSSLGPVRPRLSVRFDPSLGQVRPRLSVWFAFSPPPFVSGILLGAFTLEPPLGSVCPPGRRLEHRLVHPVKGEEVPVARLREDGVQRVLLHQFDVAEHVIGVHRSIELGVEQPARLHHVLQRVGALEVESEGEGVGP